jgi:23S rRNA pseudouridine1911/1915/1917 synthase
MTWLRNGTRLGYGVHASLGTVPASIATPTPLPEVLVVIDPERFPSMSRARKACRRGSVLVDGAEGRCITTARAGDHLELQARIAPGFTPRGKPPFALDVLFEDDALAVVFKPSGVCTHPPPGGAPGGSMRTAVMHALRPPPVGTCAVLYRPHIVHRLDKPTSGLLLCAKVS